MRRLGDAPARPSQSNQAHLLALVGRRRRVGVAAVEQVAQVEVGVAARRRGARRRGPARADPAPAWRTARPVSSTASRRAASHGVSPASTCPPGWIQMPSARWRCSTMPARPDDEGRRRHVGRRGVLGEGLGERGDLGDEPLDARRAHGRRPGCGHGRQRRLAPATRRRRPRRGPYRRVSSRTRWAAAGGRS